MFAATVINFLLSSLSAGTEVALFIVLIRKPLNLDIDHDPLPGEQGLGHSVLQSMTLVALWAAFLPVSIKLPMSDPVSICVRWRFGLVISLSFGGPGSSSKTDSGSSSYRSLCGL